MFKTSIWLKDNYNVDDQMEKIVDEIDVVEVSDEENVEIIELKANPLYRKGGNAPSEEIKGAFNCLYAYMQILQNEICVLSCGGKNVNTDFLSLMFYTIKKNQGGKLLLCLIHELDHIINQTEKGCAFESYNQLYDFHDKNPFDDNIRKYEIFNEILSDIFALEAVNYLHNNNHYLIEEKKYTSENNINFNTPSCLKNILHPFVEKFRYYICKSKINSDPSYLIDAIGLQNFESLVYSVNKIDYMIKNGLFKNDAYLNEYYAEIDKIEKIYHDIDIFHQSVKHLLKKHL
jgi:hypothetical protein